MNRYMNRMWKGTLSWHCCSNDFFHKQRDFPTNYIDRGKGFN